jgi:hypothetical protein
VDGGAALIFAKISPRSNGLIHNALRGDEMPFWPFGREPAEIEIATRVITAATLNGVKVRGKLTIHFSDPQRQADADAAADRCATVAIALLRESLDHERLIGAEAQINAQLLARYPGDIAPARAVEIAALHIVGDPALSDELRRTSGGSVAPITPTVPPPRPTLTSSGAPSVRSGAPSVRSGAPSVRSGSPSAPPRSHSPSSIAPPSSMSAPISVLSPLPPHAGYGAPPRRRGTSQIRSIHSLLMPAGSPPSAMGAFVAPAVRDSSARLLIGFLRAHDLITLRRVLVDESSAEMLASAVPLSDGPPGGYEASHSAEIARWSQAIGADVMTALHHEVNAVSVFLARDAMARVDLNRALAVAVMDAAITAAFPGDEARFADLTRFLDTSTPAFADAVVHDLTRIAGCGDDPTAMTAALRPLIVLLQEDLATAATILKLSTG